MTIKQERNYGIDLLRIVSMYMVVVLHVLGQGGVLDGVIPFTFRYDIAWGLEIASYCAVNCFALISGYVGINAKYKYSSIAKLWVKVLFYTVLITIVFAIINPSAIGKQEIVNALFPVMRGQYWYFTAYFGLFLIIPILNKGILGLTKQQLEIIILGMIFIFSLMPILLTRDPFYFLGGYNFAWLVVIYIIGAAIKKLEIEEQVKMTSMAVGYIACVLLTWAFMIVTLNIKKSGDFNAVNPEMFVNYTSPTILAAAVFLLLFFTKIRINSSKFIKVIKCVSPLAFSVYLIHTNPLVFKYVINGAFVNLKDIFAPLMGVYVLLIAVTIFITCILLDWIRNEIFKKVGINSKIEKIDNVKN